MVPLPLIWPVFALPECVQCRRSASGDQSRRWCPPGRSWPCVPLPLYGRSWPPANHSGWTRPYCGSACPTRREQLVSWIQTASHCINAAVSSRVSLNGRDVGFIACVFNLSTSSANSFGSDAPRLCTLESIRGQWALINGYNNVALRHYHANDVWMLLISSNRSGRPEVSGLRVSCSVSAACLSGRLCASVYRASYRRWTTACSRPDRTPARHSSHWLTSLTLAASNVSQWAVWRWARGQSDPEWRLLVIRGLFGTPPSSVGFYAFNGCTVARVCTCWTPILIRLLRSHERHKINVKKQLEFDR